MKENTKDTIKSLYMYIVLLAGLFMMVIPIVDLVKMGLETWAFPLAVEDEYDYRGMPPEPYFGKERIALDSAEPMETIKLTEQEQQVFENWKQDYKAWQENTQNKDIVSIRRQRNMVRDISILFGGFILFFSHGYVLRKNKKA